jgi:hypothetical protein
MAGSYGSWGLLIEMLKKRAESLLPLPFMDGEEGILKIYQLLTTAFWEDQVPGIALATVLNVAAICCPKNVVAMIIATAIRAAINAYSTAVTPDSSFKNFSSLFITLISFLLISLI